MAVKAFSIEDGNLATKPITTSQTRTYKDIDLSFANKLSGDLFKKTDAAAVKQSIKNILLTNRTEKPFRPTFGANLNRLLFSLDTELDKSEIEDLIVSSVAKFEPRAVISKIDINIQGDYNNVNITVFFRIISTNTIDQVNVSLTRLR